MEWYIDPILLAIIQNIERQREYRQNPSPQLLHEINEHSSYITNAEHFITDIHIQRSIQQFKIHLGYTEISQDQEVDSLFVLMEADVTAWTLNNAWTELDFNLGTWGDQPSLTANKGGPECDSLLNAWNKKSQHTLKQQLDSKLKELKEREANGETGL